MSIEVDLSGAFEEHSPNGIRQARVLLESGADVNARADQDGEGIGGHTPIFHAVNSIFNYCRPANGNTPSKPERTLTFE